MAGTLCAANLPFHICNAHFLASLLVIVVPFAVRKLDAREFGARLYARCKKLALCLEFGKL